MIDCKEALDAIAYECHLLYEEGKLSGVGLARLQILILKACEGNNEDMEVLMRHFKVE